MQKARADFLAGSRLSLEENGHIGSCDAFQLLTDRLHGGRAPEDDIQGREIEKGSRIYEMVQEMSYQQA
jgi:hypothetical protein